MKTYTILKTTYRGNNIEFAGTLPELIEKFAYTLETGSSYSNEKGNYKISLNPRTIKSLVSMLNRAVYNSSANGCPNSNYILVEN